MFSSSLRRVARPVAASTSRHFTVAAVVSKDFVQELYVKELKAYRPVPAAADAHLNSVKAFSATTPPKAPFVPGADELAKELEAYDSEIIAVAPEAHSSTTHAAAQHIEEGAEGADEYLKLVEADVVKAAKH